MCGIFGARWSWLARVHADPAAAAAQALRVLAWRGRDGGGTLRAGDFVLGATRLAISDRRSRQPLALRGGRFCGVLNGAITDARALWAELRPAMLRRRTLPNDAWLPLLLCARGDAERLSALHGHHALAVVDAANDTLWLARDRAGEKPLFVVRDGERVVAFASTLPALRVLGVPAQVPPVERARCFRFGTVPQVQSAPGSLGVDDAQTGVLAATAAGSHRLSATRRSPLQFAAALGAAVRRSADTEVALGLSLSGGRDSSCLAAELTTVRPGVGAYQFAAVGSDGGERAVAAAVAAHCGLAWRPVEGGPELLDALPALTRCHGLPLGDPSVLAVYAVARAAAADGVRVLLSGEGADELLFGYARHRALWWLPPCRLPVPELAGWSTSRWARTLRALAARDPYAALLAVTPPRFAAEVLTFAAGSATLPSATAIDEPRPWTAAARLQRARAVDGAFYLRRDLLPKLDVATMAAGVEGRCPFLDPDVVAAAAALPLGVAFGKAPLRAHYAPRLPAAVFAQQKRGFALPLDRWFRGPLPWLDLLRDRRTLERDHLRAGGVAAALDRHRRGTADLGHGLYLLVAFELWLRTAEEDEACA